MTNETAFRWVLAWVPARARQLAEASIARAGGSVLSSRLANGVLWSLLGAILSRSTGLAVAIGVARILGLSDFGAYTTVQGTAGLFGTLAGFGLGITATKFVAELRHSDPARCGRVIGLLLLTAVALGTLGTLVLAGFAPWFASSALGSPELSGALCWSSGLVLFTAVQGVYAGGLGGLEAFGSLARTNWQGAVWGAPLLVVGALLGGGRGAMMGATLQALGCCLIGHRALRAEAGSRGIQFRFRPEPGEAGILWRFSLPAFLSTGLAAPAGWACTALLVHQPSGFQEMALLSASGQWKNLLVFLPMTAMGVLMPMFASLHRGGETQEFHRLLRSQLRFNTGLALLLALPLAGLAPWILDCYGPGFRQGWAVFVITLLGSILQCANSLLARAMQACGRPWLDLLFNSCWVMILLSAAFVLVPSQGAVGVAWAHALAAAVLLLCQWGAVRRRIEPPGEVSPAARAACSPQGQALPEGRILTRQERCLP